MNIMLKLLVLLLVLLLLTTTVVVYGDDDDDEPTAKMFLYKVLSLSTLILLITITHYYNEPLSLLSP